MGRLTAGWTERHVTVAAAMSAAALTGGMALLAAAPYQLVGLAAVIITVVASLSLNAFGGIITGLLTAAALIASRQLGGHWAVTDFGLALSTTAAMIMLGWLSGIAGAQLRATAQGGQARAEAWHPTPAFGSLGLLRDDLAMARLDEEVARARRHHRPLTVTLIGIEVIDSGLSTDACRAAQRTVARLVETLVPETAVPFALAPDEVGAILPETDEATAWELLGPVVDAAARATFTIREQDERRSLTDCAELHAAIVELSPQLPDADRLVAVARQAVLQDRAGRVPEGTPRTGTMPW